MYIEMLRFHVLYHWINLVFNLVFRFKDKNEFWGTLYPPSQEFLVITKWARKYMLLCYIYLLYTEPKNEKNKMNSNILQIFLKCSNDSESFLKIRSCGVVGGILKEDNITKVVKERYTFCHGCYIDFFFSLKWLILIYDLFWKYVY